MGLGQNVLNDDQIAYLAKHNVIIFTGQRYYHPFEFLDKNGNYTGITIELIRWMGVELGFKPTFVPVEFSIAQQMVLNGKADVLSSLFRSSDREKLYDFSKVLFEVPASIYGKNERSDIRSYEDLLHKRIAMQRGDFAVEYLFSRSFQGNMVFSEDFGWATRSVADGKADALIGDEQIVDYYRYTNNISDKIKKIGEPLYIGKCAMAVAQGQDTLLEIINAGINLANETRILERLNRRWLGINEHGSAKYWRMYKTRILWLAGISVLLLLNMLYMNIRLRQKIQLRSRELELSIHDHQKTIYDKLKVTEDLVHNREYWAYVFNSIPEAVIVYDPVKKVITDMN